MFLVARSYQEFKSFKMHVDFQSQLQLQTKKQEEFGVILRYFDFN